VVCGGYLGSMIEDFVGDGSRFGLSVGYSFDGDPLLGTGGAIKKAMPQLGNEFLVIYGDSWLETDYAAIVERFRASGKQALMTVFRNKDAWDTSNVEFDGTRIVNYDKRVKTSAMQFIDWGLGLIKAEAFAPWRDVQVFDLADLYGRLVKEGQMAGFEVKERFYEIGSLAGLKETGEIFRLAPRK
jgi:NDP-sugar pyrophosphorylase family protein